VTGKRQMTRFCYERIEVRSGRAFTTRLFASENLSS
jgi:hypothetical protein